MMIFPYEITGAIFDVDGTLLDSMKAWEGLAERYLISKGIEPENGLSQRLKTCTVSQAAEYYRERYGLNLSVDRIIAETNDIIRRFYENQAEMKPGVKELLGYLCNQNVKMCVATATDRELIVPALKRNGIFDCFSQILCGDDVKSGKDSPEIFYKALKILKTDVQTTWVFEDALHAAQTAKKAGLKVVCVYDKTSRQNQGELMDLADLYLKSFEELDLIR